MIPVGITPPPPQSQCKLGILLPFTSHIYENQLELLHNYYIEPIDTTQTAQEVKMTKQIIQTQIIFIKIYKKNNPEKNFGQYHFC